jgi:hypothetical protein
LGGWTQTSDKPSPLSRHYLAQEKRMVAGECLNCGSKSHWAARCTKPRCAVAYKCRSCQSDVVLCGAGRSVTVARGVLDCGAARRAEVVRADSVPASALVSGATSSVPAAPAGRKEPAGKATAANAKRTVRQKQQKQVQPPRKKQAAAKRNPRAGVHVLVGGVAYSTLAWHLGRPVERADTQKARTHCAEGALELQHGVAQSLVAAGFAKVSAPMDLLAPGVALTSSWVRTRCRATRSDACLEVRLRSTGGGARAPGRSGRVLWPSSLLSSCFVS